MAPYKDTRRNRKRPRGGLPLKPVDQFTERDRERFWSYVDKAGDCWLWTGGRDGNGYGVFYLGGRLVGAHRVGFALHHGRWADPCTLHTCDTPACVRGDHLFAGTKRENTVDMVTKGRHGKGGAKNPPRGERSGTARLRDSDVLALREAAAAGADRGVLAEKYGIHRTMVNMIVRRARWKHI